MHEVPMERFRRLVFAEGVPEAGSQEGALRAIAWKLLLGYLPADRSCWDKLLTERRASYQIFCDELAIDPRGAVEASAAERHIDVSEAISQGPAVEVSVACAASSSAFTASADHPLSSAEGSTWAEWHADEAQRAEIRKDVDRTLPEYAFFNREQPLGRLHNAAISRVLFIYAKLNPGIKYVQGMNEMLAPIYYVFCLEMDDHRQGLPPAADRTTEDPADSLPPRVEAAMAAVEADAFFCFTALMAEVRDHFCSKLDHTELGITAKVNRMEDLIAAKDHELGAMLRRNKVSPTFYGFRWITLLLTQEWDLPDVLRLWDSLFADEHRFEFLMYFCAATVLSIRHELLEADDFAFAVKALQRFEARVPIHKLLASAVVLYRQDYPEPPLPPTPEMPQSVLGIPLGRADDLKAA